VAGCAGLASDLAELLDIHRPISRGRHPDKMAEEPGHVKAGKARLGHTTHLELGDFFARPFVAKLLCFSRTEGAFRFFERFFAQRRSEFVNFDSR
jgi:hypothetical protein